MRALTRVALALVAVALGCSVPARSENAPAVEPALTGPTSTESAYRLADYVFNQLEGAGLRTGYQAGQRLPLALLVDSATRRLLQAVKSPPAAESDPRWIATCNQPARLLYLLSLCQSLSLEPSLKAQPGRATWQEQEVAEAMEQLRGRLAPDPFMGVGLPEPSVTRFYRALEREVARSYPKAMVEIRSNRLHAEHNAGHFQVHGRMMDGSVGTRPRRELGPNAGGIVCDAYLFKGAYHGQLVLPQVLKEPYWNTYLYPVYSKKHDLTLWLSVRYPKAQANMTLVHTLVGLAETFEKYLPPASKSAQR